MKQYEQLDKLMVDHDGIVQTSQVVAEGISKPVFYDYIKEKKLEQVGPWRLCFSGCLDRYAVSDSSSQ